MMGLVAILPLRAVLADGSLLDSQTGFYDIGNTAYGGAFPTDIRVTIARIILIVLTFVGIIFVGLVTFAGFQYMTAAGNEEQTKKAVSLLRTAIIGLIIIMAAWAITRFFITMLGSTVDYYNIHL